MKHFITILAILFLANKLFSQTMSVEQIETDLHNTYSKLLSYRFSNNVEWDSISTENEVFNDKIRRYTSDYPQTLTFPFDSLQKDRIDIVSSKDGLFRIYSWDTWMGGTMHYFNNIYQYKTGEKVHSEFCDSDNDGPSCFYSQIFTLNANSKTYYLAISNSIYSTKDASQAIQIFAIENHLLNDSVKLIKTKSGLISSIDVSFDFFSVVDRPERPLRLIKYDEALKTIYIPIVYEDGTVTDRFILYRFTGEYFEHVETQKKRVVENK